MLKSSNIITIFTQKPLSNQQKENPKIKLQKCWAHVRRRYADIVKNLPQSSKTESLAYKILTLISKMFELEKQYNKIIKAQLDARDEEIEKEER